jgi:hypothetical protein
MHLTHAQHVYMTVVWVVAGLAWTWLWLLVWYMAFRVLRWTYLEKKAAQSTSRRWSPQQLHG